MAERLDIFKLVYRIFETSRDTLREARLSKEIDVKYDSITSLSVSIPYVVIGLKSNIIFVDTVKQVMYIGSPLTTLD